jgi:hypothetical protein
MSAGKMDVCKTEKEAHTQSLCKVMRPERRRTYFDNGGTLKTEDTRKVCVCLPGFEKEKEGTLVRHFVC